MEKVVFLDRESLNAKVRRPEFQHDWVEYDQTSPNEIINRLAEASIAITNKVPIRKETIAKLPKLRFTAAAAVVLAPFESSITETLNPEKNLFFTASKTNSPADSELPPTNIAVFCLSFGPLV